MNLRLTTIHCFLLIAILTIAYTSTIIGCEFLFDDEHFILKNLFHTSWEHFPKYFTQNMVAGAGLESNLYRPLELVTHKFDLIVWNKFAPSHKITNVLLFVLAILSLYKVFTRILTARCTTPEAIKRAKWSAFIATLLFALHPLQSADVGYLSGRSEILMILFGSLTILAFNQAMIWMLGLFFLTLISKESALVWPLMILGYDWIISGAKNWRDLKWKRHLAIWAMCSSYLALRFTVLNFQDFMNFYNTTNVLTENYSYRIYTWFSSVAKGTQLIFWPTDIHHQRHWSVYPDFSSAIVIWGALIIGACLTAGTMLLKKSPIIGVGLIWFIGATVPTSNVIVLINALFYDHWYLLPSIGLFLCIAAIIQIWLNSALLDENKRIKILFIGTLLLFLLLVPITLKQNEVWRTRANLYEYILQFEKKSITVLNNLAMEYSNTGRTEKARQLYIEAIKIDDSRPETRHNLGMIFYEEKNYQEALNQFSAAIKIKPGFYYSYMWIGRLYLDVNDLSKAEAAFTKAYRLHKDPQIVAGLQEIQRRKALKQP